MTDPQGENVNNTFRAEDGLLKVRYDRWTGFNRDFGHIFYKQPFSYYIVAAEYRFVGEQVTGATQDLTWAVRNNEKARNYRRYYVKSDPKACRY